MSLKSKGINAERELIKKFWSESIPAVRVAGSGSSRFPSPDLVVGNPNKKIAIEVKVTKEEQKYFTKKEIEELKEYSKLFGAEPWLAIKFRRSEWFFLSLEDIIEKEASFFTDKRLASLKGILFEELIKKF